MWGNLLFMSQPYAGSVDLSLSLEDIVVADPDESEIATMSMPAGAGPAEKVVRHAVRNFVYSPLLSQLSCNVYSLTSMDYISWTLDP